MKKPATTKSRGLEQLEGRVFLSAAPSAYDPSQHWHNSADPIVSDHADSDPNQHDNRHSDDQSAAPTDWAPSNQISDQPDAWQNSPNPSDSPDHPAPPDNNHSDSWQVLHDQSNAPEPMTNPANDQPDASFTADPPPPVVVFSNAPIPSPTFTADESAPVDVGTAAPHSGGPIDQTGDTDFGAAPTGIDTVTDHRSGSSTIDIDPAPKRDRPPQIDNDSPDHSAPTTILVRGSGPLVFPPPPDAPPPGEPDDCPKAAGKETAGSSAKSNAGGTQAGDAIVLNASGSDSAQTPSGTATNLSAPNLSALQTKLLAAGFGPDFSGNDSNGVILASFDINASTFASADSAGMGGRGAFTAALAEVKLIGADISDDMTAAGQMLNAGLGKGPITASTDFMKTLILCNATALAQIANTTASRIDAEIRILRREFCVVAGVGILIGIYMLKGRRDRTGSAPTSKKGNALTVGEGDSQLFAG